MDALRAQHPEYLKEIRDKKAISDELKENLKTFFATFNDEFLNKQKAA